MCIFFDKKKEICIWYVNSFFCDRVGFVVIKDYKFYKMWLRVDEFFLSEEKIIGVLVSVLFLNWRKIIIKLSY